MTCKIAFLNWDHVLGSLGIETDHKVQLFLALIRDFQREIFDDLGPSISTLLEITTRDCVSKFPKVPEYAPRG
jgi:hypothetical protein